MLFRLSRLAAWIAMLAGAGALAVSFLARQWPLLDVTSHFMVHAAGALLGGVLANLVLRAGRPLAALVTLALGAVTTVSLPPLVSKYGAASVADLKAALPAGTFRLVSANTWHYNQSYEKLAAFLETSNADVVTLVEFGPKRHRWVRRLRKTYPYMRSCHTNIYCSVAIFSKFPIHDAVVSSRDRGPGPPRVIARMAGPLNGVTLFAVHMMRPIDSYRGNQREIDLIADQVRRLEGRPVLVAGDFNLNMWSANWARFRERSGLSHMGGYLPSWPVGRGRWPQLAIDHVFASHNIQITRSSLGPDVGSDHLPLVVDFTLRSGEK